MVPFEPTTWGSWAEPLVHVPLGIGFGFALERAGFGSARKLTSQFYLNDLAVLKVMFTAIVTAMLFDLRRVYHRMAGLRPALRLYKRSSGLRSSVGLFGTGFVIGGYCPGTLSSRRSNLEARCILLRRWAPGWDRGFSATPSPDRAFGTTRALTVLRRCPGLRHRSSVCGAGCRALGAQDVCRW